MPAEVEVKSAVATSPVKTKTMVVEEKAAPAANLPEVVSYSDEGDDLLDELADDTAFMSNIRERRMAELRAQVQELEEMKQREHGTYQEVMNEKEVMNVTTTSKICVVHFFHKEFRRCMIMDKHLTAIAHKHFQTKFVKIEVENAPFLVNRLQIQTLPCVVSFIDGIGVDRIVGFEELGDSDNFETSMLEKRLALNGIISLGTPKATQIKRKTIFGKTRNADSDEDDDSD